MTATQMAHNLQGSWLVNCACLSIFPTHRNGHEDTKSEGQRLEESILGLCAGTAGKEIQNEIPDKFTNQRLPEALILGLELIEPQRVFEFAHLLQLTIRLAMMHCNKRSLG